jgi:hypothetical protein
MILQQGKGVIQALKVLRACSLPLCGPEEKSNSGVGESESV